LSKKIYSLTFSQYFYIAFIKGVAYAGIIQK